VELLDSYIPDFSYCNPWVGQSSENCYLNTSTKDIKDFSAHLLVTIPLDDPYQAFTSNALIEYSCVSLNVTDGDFSTGDCTVYSHSSSTITCLCTDTGIFAIAAQLDYDECAWIQASGGSWGSIYSSSWYTAIKFLFVAGYGIMAFMGLFVLKQRYSAEGSIFRLSFLTAFLFVILSGLRCGYYTFIMTLNENIACLENIMLSGDLSSASYNLAVVYTLHELGGPLYLLVMSGILIDWRRIVSAFFEHYQDWRKPSSFASCMTPFLFFINFLLTLLTLLYVLSSGFIFDGPSHLSSNTLLDMLDTLMDTYSFLLLGSFNMIEGLLFLALVVSLRSSSHRKKMRKLSFYMSLAALHFLFLGAILIALEYGIEDLVDETEVPILRVVLYSVFYHVLELSLAAMLFLSLFNKRKTELSKLEASLPQINNRGTNPLISSYSSLREMRKALHVNENIEKKREKWKPSSRVEMIQTMRMRKNEDLAKKTKGNKEFLDLATKRELQLDDTI
jgi:hypothetical protein